MLKLTVRSFLKPRVHVTDYKSSLVDSEFASPLQVAAYEGDGKLVAQLLEKMAEANKRGNQAVSWEEL